MADSLYLTLATSWDNKLVRGIQKLGLNSVRELWGTMNYNPVGSGREPAGRSVDSAAIAGHIEYARKAGLSFCYLLNSPCSGNQEYTTEGKKAIADHLEWISEAGADYVAMSNPFLIAFVKKNFPNLKIKASVILEIDTPGKMQRYLDMGCDIIVLSYNKNRDFTLLRSLSPEMLQRIELLTSDVCLFGCPYRHYCYNQVGHESGVIASRYGAEKSPTPWYKLYYPLMSCILQKLHHPEELVKSRWIRPEDIETYGSFGIKQFKIGTRNRQTEWLLRAARAYNDRSYKGNLLDLLGDTNLQLPDFPEPLRIEVVNSLLDGFLDHFIDMGRDCGLICGTECRYCHETAEKAVRIHSKNKVLEYTGKLEELRDRVCLQTSF